MKSQYVSVREITDDEVEFFFEHGWVHLPGLISEEDANLLLGEAQRIAGAGVEEKHREGSAKDPGRSSVVSEMFRPFDIPEDSSDILRDFYNDSGLGHAAAQLMSNRLMGPRKARRLNDNSGTFLIKMPENESGSARTPWHQDSYFPFDREGAVNFWISLVPSTPEMGTMRFLDGSHRLGNLGRGFDRDLLEAYPALRDYGPITEPHSYRPGDATANDLRLLHSAGPNLTGQTRWAYSCMFFPADTLYTGQPHRFVDDLGLKPWEPFDHPRFRIVGEP